MSKRGCRMCGAERGTKPNGKANTHQQQQGKTEQVNDATKGVAVATAVATSKQVAGLKPGKEAQLVLDRLALNAAKLQQSNAKAATATAPATSAPDATQRASSAAAMEQDEGRILATKRGASEALDCTEQAVLTEESPDPAQAKPRRFVCSKWRDSTPAY